MQVSLYSLPVNLSLTSLCIARKISVEVDNQQTYGLLGEVIGLACMSTGT